MKEEKEDARFFVTKFWPKLIERLQIAFVSMNNGTDISEQDLDIIRAQHELYHEGRIEFDNLSLMDSEYNILPQGYTEPFTPSLFTEVRDLGCLMTKSQDNSAGTEVESKEA